ncbi:MAG: hypothetical protein DBX91_05275 [Subdoligranulum variabile]|nr:MAG: hypothetical protein DBX91_05275 [Subdoligranulum variabile]
MSILKSLQEFLSGYPDMRPVRILTDGVSEDAESYAVSPAGNIRISEDILGNRTYENDYVFLARECTADEVDRQDNYDFLEGLFEWLENGSLPNLPGNYKAERIIPSNVLLLDIGENGSGIYQIQIKLTFVKLIMR